MKKYRLGVLSGFLAILIAAFLLINFHAAVSNTRSQNNIVTSSMGDQLPDVMQRRDPITIVVEGDGPFVNTLQKSISAQMRNAGMGNVRLASGQTAVVSTPVLLMKVSRPKLIWTPFFGTSQFTVKVGYASNGDLSFLEKTPVTYNNQNGSVLNMSAEYQVDDQSWGILSYPGYVQVLSDWLARTIVDATVNLYQEKTGLQ
jgi:hypothetical protein